MDKAKKPKEAKGGRHKKTNNKAQKIAMEAAMQMRGASRSLGSYAGTAHDGGKPEQDADDL